MNIEARREEALARLAALRDARGAAMADGLAFDDRRIAQAEIDLERIADEQAALSLRSRLAAEQALRARREQARSAVEASERRRLKCIERAERACREFVQAIRDLQVETKIMLEQLSAVQIAPPMQLAGYIDNLSHRVVAEFSKIDPERPIAVQFGKIRFGSTYYQAGDDWVASEAINIEELFDVKARYKH
jgi:hypothetical protein